MFDCGAFTTITPRSVAAATSTLSSPMPARPTTTRSAPASSTSAVTWVAERMTSALGAGHQPSSELVWACSAEPDVDLDGRRRRHAARDRSRSSFSVTSDPCDHGSYSLRPLPPTDASAEAARWRPAVASVRRPRRGVVGEREGQPRSRARRRPRRGRPPPSPRRARARRARAWSCGVVPPSVAAEHPLERREGVERALGLQAGDARIAVEHAVDGAAAAVERLAHLRDRRQVARHGGERGALRRRWRRWRWRGDCRLVAASMTSGGPIIHPTRQPVMA